MRKVNRDTLPHLVNCAVRLLRTRYDTAWSQLAARWWGVQLSENCKFHGTPIFRRHPGSEIEIGKNCSFNSAYNSHQGGIARPCILWTTSKGAIIKIGEGCGLSGTVVSASCSIYLGKSVRCGTNTRIMDSDMHSDDPRAAAAKAVYIEDNVWLGLNTVVIKGVTIGAGTMVGAGSLVTKSLPPGVVAAGVPARVIRAIKPEPKRTTQ